MKMLIKMFVLISVLLGVAGCNNETSENPSTEIVEKTYMDCSISFTNDAEEEIENKECPINSKILVKVNFTFYNLDQVDDVVDFKVQLSPGASTYSVYEWVEGSQEPINIPYEKDNMEEDGLGKIIVISGMQFQIKKEVAKRPHHYVFEISGKSAYENCEFKVIFTPEERKFGNKEDFTFREKFNFVENI